MKTIAAEEFGILPGNDRWSSLKIQRALQACREEEESCLVFEEGVYHFYPDYAQEILMYIPNHDEDTIKRVVFAISDSKNLQIKGNKTEFIFHTDVLPFYLYHSENISISGISIDYERPAYSEGTIIEASPQKMSFTIDQDKYPYEIKAGRIYFQGENFSNELDCGCLEMDADRKAPVYEGHDISFYKYSWSYLGVWSQTVEGNVEVTLPNTDQEFLKTSKVGNKMVFRHHLRNYPAIYMKESKDIYLQEIAIFHCEGMGVIAEFSENITIDKFRVAISEKNPRIFTSAADATHFVYCKGKIWIKNSLFENQLDDPVNVHGIYQRIHKIISEKECILQLMEHQQKGVKIGDVGDRLAVINNETMLEDGMLTIVELQRINKDFCYLRTKEAIPTTTKEKFVVENIEYVPDVLIEHCVFQNNRARGLLLTSAGDVVVRNNVFRTAGAAILIEGDSNYWFESGGTKHVRIEGNVFIDCSYVSDWGNAPIQISPSANVYEDGRRYHKCVEIMHNQFQCFDERLLFARNTEKISWIRNVVKKTNTYPPIEGERFVLEGILEFHES